MRHPIQTSRLATLSLLLPALLLGCGKDNDAATAQPSSSAPSAVVPAPRAVDLTAIDSDSLRLRAEQALGEKRLYEPAGNNAIEYYLALLAKMPGDVSSRNALVELQPYALIATEQALLREDSAEARRLLALMTRSDPAAPALPRLRESLRQADASAEEAKQLALTEAEDLEKAELLAAAELKKAPVTTPAVAVPAPAPPPATSSAAPAPSSVAAAPKPAAPTPAASPRRVEPPTPAPAPDVAQARSSMPRLLSDAAPRYPLIALNRRIEGSVVVAFSIGPDGSVSNVRVQSATPPGIFDRAAQTAAENWRFEATGSTASTTRTLNFTLPPLSARAPGTTRRRSEKGAESAR